MLVGTATAIVWMFGNFVTADDFEEYVIDQYYENFYETLDRLEDADEEGNEAMVRELARRLEKLKARICSQDPDWIRCNQRDID